MVGLYTDIDLLYAARSGIDKGFDVYAIIDASGATCTVCRELAV